MKVKQIKGIGRKLKAFLQKFDDCFSRIEPRLDLLAYVKVNFQTCLAKA